MRVYCIESGPQDGVYNMALDEALLEALRFPDSSLLDALRASDARPALVVRTYQWARSTLSLGVNQATRDIRRLLAAYGFVGGAEAENDLSLASANAKGAMPDVVRRPTGGRAILHGEDVSFSFVTTDSARQREPLSDSYCFFTKFVRATLERLNIPLACGANAGTRDYLRSPVCFETQTPSDLLSANGDKLCGSAQLRRQGGILQHGAAFLKPYGIPSEAFTQTLFAVVAEHYGLTVLEPFPLAHEAFASRLSALEADYRKSSGEILASASVTSGSHLDPASP